MLSLQQAKSFFMANNIFISQDPTLGSRSYDSPVSVGEYERMEQQLAEKLALLRQTKQQVMQQQQQPMQAPQSRTPVWDEIDNLISSLNDKEYEYVMNDPDFIEGQNQVMAILQRVYMDAMRPLVEGTKEGKEALEAHLAITKRVKKRASKEVDAKLSDFEEYTQKYPNMTYADYQKMKREQAK